MGSSVSHRNHLWESRKPYGKAKGWSPSSIVHSMDHAITSNHAPNFLEDLWLDIVEIWNRATSVPFPFSPTLFHSAKLSAALVHTWVIKINKASSCNCMQFVYMNELLCDFVCLTSLFIQFLPICDIKDQMSDVYLKHKLTLTGIKDIVCSSVCVLCIWAVWQLLCDTWCLKSDVSLNYKQFFPVVFDMTVEGWYEMCVPVSERGIETEQERLEVWFLCDGVSLKIHDIKDLLSNIYITLTREFTAFYFLLYVCDCWRFGCLIAVWRGVSYLCSFVAVSADIWH